ncbi:MAG: DUF2853 family protein [Campylobacterota bacterium]|nr:DUF2853 family protein [Campylobacterota bacterium]
MEKQNIFKRVDTLYTKFVEYIIGEMPIDGSPEDIAKKEIRERTLPKDKIARLKESYILAKEKTLNLGKSNDSSLLYSEVVKKEKKATEDIDKKDITTKNSSTQKDVTIKSSKKPTKKTTKISSDKASKKSTKKIEKETVEKKSKTSSTKRADKIVFYIKDIQKHYGEVDEAFVAIIVKNLGPSIYNKHAELVSCQEHKELETVRRNFLINKLGIDASRGVLDAAIQDVCEELEDAPKKYRATFYYALAKKFKKESVLS